MSAPLAVWILLAIAVAATALSALGILLVPDVFERLHFMAPAATVGVAALAAAVVVQESLSQAGIKAILTALVVFAMNPVLTHATARAIRIHQHGQWGPAPEEHIEVAGTEARK